jgi:hypothetical protein
MPVTERIIGEPITAHLSGKKVFHIELLEHQCCREWAWLLAQAGQWPREDGTSSQQNASMLIDRADHVSEVKCTVLELRAEVCKLEFQCVSDHLMLKYLPSRVPYSVKYVPQGTWFQDVQAVSVALKFG